MYEIVMQLNALDLFLASVAVSGLVMSLMFLFSRFGPKTADDNEGSSD